jgi:hypothetical protein
VTYQLTMRGCDGMVVASDEIERLISEDGKFGITNKVNKIETDESRQFCWAYSGQLIAPIFSRHFKKAMNASPILDYHDAVAKLDGAVFTATDEWRETTSPAGPQGAIVLACGASKKIFRSIMSRSGSEELRGMCISGQNVNLAAFLPQRLSDQKLLAKISVDELVYLAAFSIRSAHDLDSAMIDGLDIAVYLDSVGKFEFVDGEFYWKAVEKMDDNILQALTDASPAIQDHLRP